MQADPLKFFQPAVFSKQIGLALDEVRKAYYNRQAPTDVHDVIKSVLNHERLSQIERATLIESATVGAPRPPLFSQGGIHYWPKRKSWLPLGFINVQQLGESKLWTGFETFVQKCGHENHISLGELGSDGRGSFLVHIPTLPIDLLEEIRSAHDDKGASHPNLIREALAKHDDRVLSVLTDLTYPSRIFTPQYKFSEPWIESEEARNDWFNWLRTEPTLKLFTSLYFTVRKCTSDTSPPQAIFLNIPQVGGYAFVGGSGTDLQIPPDPAHSIFERVLYTIALLDGKLTSSQQPRQTAQVEDNVRDIIKPALKEYLSKMQKPAETLKDVLLLDEGEPFRYVERVGHKKAISQDERKKLLVVRLAAKEAAAVNFLYADNATVMNRIKGFLDGLLSQLRKDGKPYSSEAILDVYVAPNVVDVNTRILNLYAHNRLPVNPESIYGKWYRKIVATPSGDGDIEMPCVIYRYSETVGPSILVSEVATAIAQHLCADGHDPTPTLPIRVLNLFSGTGSGELTLWDAFKRHKKDPSKFVSILSLDLNPISLLSKDSHRGVTEQQFEAEREVVKSAMRVSHSIPTDIFSLLASDPRESENTYLREYDVIMADPPHYLVMDFLFQRHPKTEEYLFKQLADESTGAFILYFGHEEVEWMNFYIHWHLQNMGWPVIWNVLLGEERLILCFGHDACVQKKQCRNDLLHRLTKIRDDYYGAASPLEVFDTFMRRIHEEA